MQCSSSHLWFQVGSSRQLLQVCTQFRSRVCSDCIQYHCCEVSSLLKAQGKWWACNAYARQALPTRLDVQSAPDSQLIQAQMLLCSNATVHRKLATAVSSSMLALSNGVYSAVIKWSLLSHIFLSHVSWVCLLLQTGLANIYANYWSLRSLLCRQLLTFRVCSSLRCTFQAPFPFLFQMSSTSLRGCRTKTWSITWNQYHTQAL